MALIKAKQLNVLVGQGKWDASGITLPSGTTKEVTTVFSGKTSGGTDSQVGVYTTSPQNKVYIRLAGTGKQIVDEPTGLQVYARLTFATSVWTLTFYTAPAGVETAYDFTGHDNAGDAFDFRWCETVQINNSIPTRIVQNGESIDEFTIQTATTTYTPQEETLTISSNGQTAFTLSATPNPITVVSFEINGVDYLVGAGKDFTVSGTALTWLDSDFTLETTDVAVAKYYTS